MLATQRRQRLIERLEHQGALSSAEAAQEFGVSMLTIRRDLELLEQQGLVRRTHGGAQLLAADVAYAQRARRDLGAKRRIGEYAASLVEDGDTIFLDAGTTTLEVARALRRRPLKSVRVVTHAVNIAAELVNHPPFKVFCIGGEIFEETYACTGQVAVEAIGRYSYDRLFLACMGFDLRGGITNARVPEVEVKAAALAHSRWTCLVADASKWGVNTFARVAPLSSVQGIVSDERLPEDGRSELARLGVDVWIAR